ncbi:MAG: hypothetical protein LC808_27315, partial [Actinobacteria bacterium]|nr:hypothetical protein [Actinomycetota bacterium]
MWISLGRSVANSVNRQARRWVWIRVTWFRSIVTGNVSPSGWSFSIASSASRPASVVESVCPVGRCGYRQRGQLARGDFECVGQHHDLRERLTSSWSRDEENLVLMSSERFEAGLTTLRVAARALAVLARHDLRLTEELPWLHWLPEQERQTCIRELLAHLVAGADTGLLLPFGRALT